MTEKDDIGERISHLEGIVEAEDNSIEHRIESIRHSQILLISVMGLSLAAAVAILVYLLQRLDTLSLMIKHG